MNREEVLALRTAAIGIGSNSLRMLVADIDAAQGKLHRVKRYREGLRVFAALDKMRNILPEMIDKACTSVEIFRRQAIDDGAECVHLFATSAVRDAANQQAFLQAMQQRTGLKLEVCSGEEEAKLSFLGAWRRGLTGMIDIGGGSTELALGDGQALRDAISLQMGAVRLHRQFAIATVDDAEQVVGKARKLLAPVADRFCAPDAAEWIGVGGTFTTSAALAQNISWQERDKIHDYVLTQEAMRGVLTLLAPMPLEKRLKLACMQPQRADIVVHGVAILLACMEMLKIERIVVSECGNLEGYLKAKYLFE